MGFKFEHGARVRITDESEMRVYGPLEQHWEVLAGKTGRVALHEGGKNYWVELEGSNPDGLGADCAWVEEDCLEEATVEAPAV